MGGVSGTKYVAPTVAKAATATTATEKMTQRIMAEDSGWAGREGMIVDPAGVADDR